MKIPLSWLKDILPTKLEATEIAENLTLLGLEVEAIVSKENDQVLEISLTPNLAHCLSVRGVARELAALTGEQMAPENPIAIPSNNSSIHDEVKVTVENSSMCPRYACRLIENVMIGPSPKWLKERIELSGMRSVNNVVDITNYILLEYGHPLHAFDFDKIAGKKVLVRNARPHEKITTLDGKEHFPTEETLLICDEKGAIALAGIMGSANSEVSEKTKRILLESAYFDPKMVRRSSKRMDIHTEGSYRFERGCDPNGVDIALDKAAQLICQFTQGQSFKGKIDIKSQEFQPLIVTMRLNRANHILGTQLAMGEVESLLKRLGFVIQEIKNDLITVKVPTYRHDIRQEIDLIEEIARIYGFDNIRKKEKVFFRLGSLSHSPAYLFEKEIREKMIGSNLQELLTCNLISPEEAANLSQDIPSRTLINILNPSSAEQSVLRPSLLPGLLKVVKFNIDHDRQRVYGFETGKVHFKSKDQFLEPPALGIVLTGKRDLTFWGGTEGEVDFFDLKGIIENLLISLKAQKIEFVKAKFGNFHPGRQAAILVDGVEVGTMGEVHPDTLKKLDIKQAVFFAELNLDDLSRFSSKTTKMAPLPQFPASTRDLTLTIDQKYPVQKILSWVHEAKRELLESCTLLDLYEGEKVEKGKKNITFRFTYRDWTKTLSLAQVEEEHQRIEAAILEKIKEDQT